ncbi:MAG TPA: hypothetical protein VGN90_12290 [Pyrinomonadaceae bacterium]|jgi:hypothetical protein|nr:hypothetical protein [Pyrinomonadaceae bacterium]
MCRDLENFVALTKADELMIVNSPHDSRRSHQGEIVADIAVTH